MDIMRGIAILLVLGVHFKLDRPSAGLVGGFAELWHQYGSFGVQLFFVLSGFLIGGLLLAELGKHGHIDIAHFLIRRGLKIYPPYYVFLLYLIAMPLLKAMLYGRDIGRTAGTLFVDYWPNFVFLQNYVGPEPAGHTWSLSVEEHFYFLLPFIIVALASAKRTRLLMPICLLSPLLFTVVRSVSAYLGDPYLWSLNRTMAATHLRLDGLLLGVGLRALAEFRPDLFAALRPWRSACLGFAALLFYPHASLQFLGVPIDRVLPISALAASALFVGIYHTRARDFGRLERAVRFIGSPIAAAGVYSYSIYLWHVTVIGIIEQAIARVPVRTSIPFTWLCCALTTSLCAVAAGVAAARIVEWPVLRLRDRFFPSRSSAAPNGQHVCEAFLSAGIPS
jgi:peptidoglycan/LPS O-acetylase OafA/YrhL